MTAGALSKKKVTTLPSTTKDNTTLRQDSHDEDFQAFSASARSLPVLDEDDITNVKRTGSSRSIGLDLLRREESARSVLSLTGDGSSTGQCDASGNDDSFHSIPSIATGENIVNGMKKHDSSASFHSIEDEKKDGERTDKGEGGMDHDRAAVQSATAVAMEKHSLSAVAVAASPSTVGADMISSSTDTGTADPAHQFPKKKRYVSPKDFEFLKVIGMGAFGKVLQVRNKSSNQILAMKVISKRLLKRKSTYIENIQAERDILTKVRHPFIVSMHCSFQTREKLFIIMDFLAGGELFLRLGREGVFLERTAAFYLAEIILALEHLHNKGILHRDLKPENILLGSDGHLCLTDFGLAKDFSLESDFNDEVLNGGRARTVCGTQEYMAPEMVARKGYGKAADFWSLGCIAYEMLAGEPPFQSRKGSKDLFRKIMNERVKMPPGSSAAACRLLKGLLNRDASARLGASKGNMFQVGGVAELKQIAFFGGLDWGKLERKEIDPPEKLTVENEQDLRHFHDEFTQMRIPRSVTEMSKEEFRPKRCKSDAFRGFSFIHDDFALPDRAEEDYQNYWNQYDEDGESVSECASSKFGDETSPELVAEPITEKKKRPPRKKKKKKAVDTSPSPSETSSVTAASEQGDEPVLKSLPEVATSTAVQNIGLCDSLVKTLNSVSPTVAAMMKDSSPNLPVVIEDKPGVGKTLDSEPVPAAVKDTCPKVAVIVDNRPTIAKAPIQKKISPKWEAVGKPSAGTKLSKSGSQSRKNAGASRQHLPQALPVGDQAPVTAITHGTANSLKLGKSAAASQSRNTVNSSVRTGTMSQPYSEQKHVSPGIPPSTNTFGLGCASAGASSAPKSVQSHQVHSQLRGSWATGTTKAPGATLSQRPVSSGSSNTHLKAQHQNIAGGHRQMRSGGVARQHQQLNNPPPSPDWRDHKMKFKPYNGSGAGTSSTMAPQLPPSAPDLWPSLGDFPPPPGGTNNFKSAKVSATAPRVPQGAWAPNTLKQKPKAMASTMKTTPAVSAWAATPGRDSDHW